MDEKFQRTPRKRKLSEYQDPDYLKSSTLFQKRKIDSQYEANKICFEADKIVANKREKICSIIQNEFRKELENKEKEILTISNRLSIAKKLLHKIRYAVVANYYNKSVISNLEKQEIVKDNSSNNLNQQTSFHPAVKDVLGMKYEDFNELLKIRPTRQAAQNAKTTIKEKLQTKKDKRDEKLKYQQNTEALKRSIPKSNLDSNIISSGPRYLMKWEKPVAKINTSRGINQTRHLIVVGNTSKYIGNESSTDNATHKWLIYCQSRTKYPIEQFIQKIRFVLHASYKPNDIIDVNSPPFQLTRRGWGEFPVQVQLFFHSQLQQKPLQLVHNLILDKKMTGLQTMGSETLLEIWLRSNFFKETLIQSNNSENLIKFSSPVDSITDCNNSDDSESSLNISETELKFPERLEISDEESIQIPENLPKQISLEIEHKNCNVLELKSGKQMIEETSDSRYNTVKKEIYKNPKIAISSSKITFINQKRNQQSLLKPQISLLKKSLINTKNEYIINRYPNTIDHDYTSPSLINVENNKQNPEIKIDKIIKQITNKSYQKDLEEIFYLKKFSNENQAIEFLYKSIPLINVKAKDGNYKISFPFVVENLETFHKLIAPKRKSNEWLQAKYFSQLMQNHQQFMSSYWTTREILVYSRSHGFSPNMFISEKNTPCQDFNELIKNEIKKQIVEPLTVTSCNPIYTWINDIKQKNICNLNKIDHDEILDIEKVDGLNKEVKKEISPEKHNRIILDVPKYLELEDNLVKDSCLNIGVQLKCEEIIINVDCPAAEIVLSKALRCFIENLIRRTVFKVNESSQKDSVIECHHVKNAILTDKKLDFLTNNYLGM